MEECPKRGKSYNGVRGGLTTLTHRLCFKAGGLGCAISKPASQALVRALRFVTKLEQDHVLPLARGTSDIPNEEDVDVTKEAAYSFQQ